MEFDNKFDNRTKFKKEHCDTCNSTKHSEEAVDYGYYSKVLNKPFDSITEMRAEEKKYQDAQREKEELANKKRTRAKEVEDAYNASMEVRKEAKKLIDDAKTKASEMIAEVDKKYEDLKNKFISDYGSFHMTYTSDNSGTTTTVSDLIDSIFKLWF